MATATTKSRYSLAGHRNRYETQKRGVVEFFSDPKKWDVVYEYIRKDVPHRFSRRFWDYLVTEYARAHNCQYRLRKSNGSVVLFNIYHSAQTLLLGVHKKGVDAFNRKNKLLKDGGRFEFGHGRKRVVTSVGQLNFFRWLIQNRVNEFGEKNEDKIKREMAATSLLKRRSTGKKRKAEQEIPDQPKKRQKQTTEPLEEVVIRLKKAKENAEDSEEEMKLDTNLELLHRQRKRVRKRMQPNRVDIVINNDCEYKFIFAGDD